MLEPESGERGCTFAVSSWDSSGKLKLSCGGLSLSGSLASATDADCFDENSLFIGERKAVKLSLGGAASESLRDGNLFEELGFFLKTSVTSGWSNSSFKFLLSKSWLRTYSWDWESV